MRKQCAPRLTLGNAKFKYNNSENATLSTDTLIITKVLDVRQIQTELLHHLQHVLSSWSEHALKNALILLELCATQKQQEETICVLCTEIIKMD